MITIDDFQKLEIKIGTILEAEKVPDTDKLVKLIVDLGDEKRTIVAGIALAYPEADKLIGKQLPILTNLEPRTLRGLESHGMILCASSEDGIALLNPDKSVPPGSTVR